MATNSLEKALRVLDPQSKVLIELLVFGLKKFYKIDAEALFGHGENPMHINEQAMVGCVYRYMYGKLNATILSFPHIDIEYNRMLGMYEDEIEKAIHRCSKCKVTDHQIECIAKEDVYLKWLANLKSKKDYKGIRPDIIVHERNKPNNGLIIEFKKKDCDVTYDVQKVRYATCHHSPLHYIIGAVVRLRRSSADVDIYQSGSFVCKVTVPLKKRHKEHDHDGHRKSF